MYVELVFIIIDKDEKVYVPFIEIHYFFIFFYFFFNKDEVDTGFTTVTEFSAHRILYSKNIYKIISIIYVKNTTREQNL